MTGRAGEDGDRQTEGACGADGLVMCGCTTNSHRPTPASQALKKETGATFGVEPQMGSPAAQLKAGIDYLKQEVGRSSEEVTLRLYSNDS
jgi:hypothetical protein